MALARGAHGKGGVIWHTQGSGNSLLMTSLTGALMHDPAMENHTVVLLTDRNDLDNQLFETFGRCTDLLGKTPVRAGSVAELKPLLDRQVGGIVFSTIEKFQHERGEDFPELTDRLNVIVPVDEAHRTQYGFESRLDRDTGEMRRGLARQLRRALQNAVYVAFTGTSVDLVGANTSAVFSDYIDVYDIARAANIDLDEDVAGTFDAEFDEVTEDMEDTEAGAVARRWSRVEALIRNTAGKDWWCRED